MAHDVVVRSIFIASLPPALAALLQPQTIATPLLVRFNTGLAPHVDALRAVLELPQFAPPAITTGTQNASAGASGAAPRGEEGGPDAAPRAPRPRTRRCVTRQ